MVTSKKYAKSKEQTQVDSLKSSSNELLESVVIENTPFIAHRYEECWILTCGRLRTSKQYQNMEQIMEDVKNPSWEILTVAIQGLIDFNNNTKSENK